jgi:FkbM family methyltransferase
MPTRKYGPVATVHESTDELTTLFEEVEEYFDCGATISAGDTVVDVGANIGAFAIAAGKRAQGKLKLHCFEPVPTLFQALSRNLRENNWLRGGAHNAFNVALSTQEEANQPCEFYYFRRFPRDSTMDLEGKRREFEAFFAAKGKQAGRAVSFLGPIATVVEKTFAWLPQGPVGRWASDQISGLERIQVPRDTLPAILGAQNVERVDLLKIDVEGAEAKVLAGIDPSFWGRIRQVVIESDGVEANMKSLIDLVKSRGLGEVRTYAPPSMSERGLANMLIYATAPAAPLS